MGNAVKLDPTVCVVGNTYQIMAVVEEEALLSVRVGDKTYYHHSNGIRISSPGSALLFPCRKKSLTGRKNILSSCRR